MDNELDMIYESLQIALTKCKTVEEVKILGAAGNVITKWILKEPNGKERIKQLAAAGMEKYGKRVNN